jgi:hypothetical protein
VKVRFTVLGQAASKANSRRIVQLGDRRASIKSREALVFEAGMLRQIPSAARLMLAGECGIRLRIYYVSQRSDLDESIVLDCLQARYKTIHRKNGSSERVLLQRGVVVNDRQFKQKHVYHGIDKLNPRVEVTVWELKPQRQGVLI